MSFMTKTRQDNVIDHTCAVYDENNTKLSWLIKLGTDSDGNQIGQLCD